MKLSINGIDTFPLCLGGNVFGGNASVEESFAVLDAYREAGGNFIDTADLYLAGRSEEVLGEWLKDRGCREEMVVATKVGKLEGLKGQAPGTIRAALEASLKRLQTDHVDLYYAHADDPDVPLEESLGTYTELVKEGKVHEIGASNFSGERLQQANNVSERESLSRFIAIQNQYNLLEREGFESDLAEACSRNRVASVPYFGLASGFLTGKYKQGEQPDLQGRKLKDEARTSRAEQYRTPRGLEILSVVEEVADEHATTIPAVALAWLRAQPTVAAPSASARTPEQLAGLLPMATLELGRESLDRLNAVSAPRP